MCTMRETKVTTHIIMAVRPSIRKPISIFKSPTTIQVYSVSFMRAPS